VPDLRIVTEVDWAEFAGQSWDRQPVLFEQISSPPFVAPEVFVTAVEAARLTGESTLPHCQFTIERNQQTEPMRFLPAATDATFDGYEQRMATELDGRRYALVINGFHGFHHPLWDRERAFFSGLWDQVGLPPTGAITTLFHGTYEHSPVGVHKDRFATFMVGLRGRKRMRFWPRRPWHQPVSSILDYEDYLPESFAVEIGPGDVLYWPASYYHVGESAGGGPATSVNIGVPRTEHRIAYELAELRVETDRPVPPLSPGADEDGRLSPELPPALAEAVHAYRTKDLAEWSVQVSARKWVADGFEPAPQP
jgi:50S ribosomal protein L16 3-hydroxylase